MGDYKILGLAEQPKYKIIGPANVLNQEAQEAQEENLYQPSSSIGAFFRSAGRAIPEALQNITNKATPLFSPLDKVLQQHGVNLSSTRKNIIPEFLQEKPGDAEHPIAQFLGSSLGFAPLGGGTIAAGRAAIPVWNAIARQAMPSFLRRVGIGSVEGSALGGIYSPKENQIEGILTGGLLGGAGYGLVPSLSRFIKNFPGRFKSIRDIDRLKSSLEEAGVKKEETEKILKQAQLESHHEFNTSNPDSLTYRINEAKKRNKELTNQIKHTEEYNIPQSYKFEKITPKIKSLLEIKEQQLATKEKQLSEYLGEGQLHHERFGKIIGEERNKLISENKIDYNKLKDNLDSKNVIIENKSNITPTLQNISEAIKQYGLESHQVKKLVDKINSISHKTITPANDYLSLNRSLNNEAHQAWLDAKENPDAIARDKSYKRYLELKKQANITYKILKENIGKDDAELLEKANTQFRNIIIPMRRNSVFREIDKYGKVKGNLLEKSIGSEQGLNILQNMIASNPELQRLAIGQKFASEPSKLHKPNELLQEKYLPNMPKLKQLLHEHQESLKEHMQTKKSLELAKIHDMEQSIIAKQHEVQRKQIKKEYDKKLAESIKAKKEYDSNEIKIIKIEKIIQSLRNKQSDYEISDKKYKDIESIIKSVEKDKEQLKKRTLRLGITLASLGGVITAIKKTIK